MVCVSSELEQPAAETLGAAAGSPSSFQAAARRVSSAGCRLVLAASSRVLGGLLGPKVRRATATSRSMEAWH